MLSSLPPQPSPSQELKEYILTFSRQSLEDTPPETLIKLIQDLKQHFIRPFFAGKHTLTSLDLSEQEYWLVNAQISRISHLFKAYTYLDLGINERYYTVTEKQLDTILTKKL